MPAPTTSTLIDWVDDSDRIIGQVRRGEVFERHAGFRVAHIFVFNREGELLLQQVGHGRRRSPLRWGSSVAAYLLSGETYEDAARRRLWEELRLRSVLEAVGNTKMADDGATKFIELYTTVADEPEVGDTQHIEAIRFVSLAEVSRLLEASPASFTETFPEVYQLYQASRN